MNKYIAIFILFLPNLLVAQQKAELGVFLGFANYQGDLSPEIIELTEIKFSYGAFFRYHASDKIKIRANAVLGFISGSDSNDNNGSLKNRGWSFEASIFEINLLGEYHPFSKSRIGISGVFQRQVSPYVFAGVGMVNSSPTVSISRPEDEGLFPEAGFEPLSLILPFGGGLRADLFEFASIGAEAGYRFTFTDYLDGVKENGNGEIDDYYFFFGITLSFYLGSSNGFDF